MSFFQSKINKIEIEQGQVFFCSWMDVLVAVVFFVGFIVSCCFFLFIRAT